MSKRRQRLTGFRIQGNIGGALPSQAQIDRALAAGAKAVYEEAKAMTPKSSGTPKPETTSGPKPSLGGLRIDVDADGYVDWNTAAKIAKKLAVRYPFSVDEITFAADSLRAAAASYGYRWSGLDEFENTLEGILSYATQVMGSDLPGAAKMMISTFMRNGRFRPRGEAPRQEDAPTPWVADIERRLLGESGFPKLGPVFAGFRTSDTIPPRTLSWASGYDAAMPGDDVQAVTRDMQNGDILSYKYTVVVAQPPKVDQQKLRAERAMLVGILAERRANLRDAAQRARERRRAWWELDSDVRQARDIDLVL